MHMPVSSVKSGCRMPAMDPVRSAWFGFRLTACIVRRLVCTVLVLTFAGAAAQISAQESEAELERVNRVDDLLRILNAGAGASIADVGAGDGFFSVRIARAVGPSGHVVAVDISEAALSKLRERATRDGATVEAVLGAVDDPHLDAGRFDAVLIHNAYHEMTQHEAMLAHIHAALKPGGRLVIVEPMHDSSRGLSRDKQVAQHDIEAGIVEQELRAADFDVVERDNEFVKFTGVAGGFWLIVARRQGAGEAASQFPPAMTGGTQPEWRPDFGRLSSSAAYAGTYCTQRRRSVKPCGGNVKDRRQSPPAVNGIGREIS